MSKQINQALVRIQDSDGNIYGAGFLVCCNQILTCAHVVADSLKVSRNVIEVPTQPVFLDFPLLDKKSTPLSAVIKYWDVTADIALLELLTEVPNSTLPIILDDVDDYSYCDFGVCGFPKDMGDWTYGKMLGKLENGYIQVESETAHRIQGGYSGGPVWHITEERLAGMVVASDESQPKDKIAYIIPTSVILNILPKLSKPNLKTTTLKHACFLSFPIDSNNPLIDAAVREIQTDLDVEISAQLRNKKVLAKSTRTARELCESACMVMLYTFRYFDRDDPLCAQEYQAMSLIEQERLKDLKVHRAKENSFIIPIVLRGKDKFPDEISSFRPVYDFVKYFMLTSHDRRRRSDYRKDIAEIAQHIVAQYLRLEQNLDNPCSNCTDYELPKVKDVQHLFKNLTPRYVL